MKYRKRPVVIDAVPYEPGMEDAFLLTFDNIIVEKGDPRLCFQHVPIIKTLEGPHAISPGDWIITGVKGERYSIKPDIFEATYEPADGDSTQPRAEVSWFAGEMERQLRTHDEKKGAKGWYNLRQAYLDQLLVGEVQELRTAIMLERPAGEVIHEAADVANASMMIADNARREGEKP